MPRCFGLFLVTAAAVRVRRIQLADQLADDEIHVPPRHRVVDQAAVLRAHRGPVHAVHSGVVEIVALEAPRVVEDLTPLGARVDGRLHLGGPHRLLELLIGLDLDDRELAFLDGEDLLAICRRFEAVRIIDDGLLFALVEVVEEHRALVGARARAGPARVQELALHGEQRAVVARLQRQDDGAALEPVVVDGDLRRRRRDVVLVVLVLRSGFRRRLCSGLGLRGRGLRIAVLLVVSFRAVLLLFVFAVLLLASGFLVVLGVVSWRCWRGLILLERHGHDVGGVGVGPGVVEPPVHRIERTVRREKEVLAFGIERRAGRR